MSVRLDIIVNGQAQLVSQGTTVAALLSELGLTGKPVAVERNHDVVPRALHASTVLAAGDRLEVVTFVGGG
jgi:sulfur carrier protein